MHYPHEQKREEEVTPHAWMGVLIALVVLMLIAAMITGIWYFLRGRKNVREPVTVCQVVVLAIR